VTEANWFPNFIGIGLHTGILAPDMCDKAPKAYNSNAEEDGKGTEHYWDKQYGAGDLVIMRKYPKQNDCR